MISQLKAYECILNQKRDQLNGKKIILNRIGQI
jgi:hypothetical protein